MRIFIWKIKTLFKLGIANFARFFIYKLSIKLRLNKACSIKEGLTSGLFFRPVTSLTPALPVQNNWQDTAMAFGRCSIPITTSPPDWHKSVISGLKADSQLNWWEISDFKESVGDIKGIWELSRFDWVIAFAQRASTNDLTALNQLNTWLSDWCLHNRYYKGSNWKCGQEASIRIIHLATAAIILAQTSKTENALLSLVEAHLDRIAPTINYAIAQDNNHGTSEAAALFVGGSWLNLNGRHVGKNWSRLGRKWLENRAKTLIHTDGTFSQYSLNYHRVMLDTFCLVEVWRIQLGLVEFSPTWYSRAKAATNWLWIMVDSVSGDGPNIGANDGARLVQLTNTDYRDFRPTVQTSMALFNKKLAYKIDGEFNLNLSWLGIESALPMCEPPKSSIFDKGGFAVLRKDHIIAAFRYPRFRFRPSQSDALHVDLWIGGKNIFCDAGTYSYNTDTRWLNYFPSVAAHNTIQFDDRDQMPKLSRFLYGEWLKSTGVDYESIAEFEPSVAAGYTDTFRASHHRRLKLRGHCLEIQDSIGGFNNKAVLRWRLPMSEQQWLIDGNTIKNSHHSLVITASMPIIKFSLTIGWSSIYYNELNEITVLEVEFNSPGSIVSEYTWLQ